MTNQKHKFADKIAEFVLTTGGLGRVSNKAPGTLTSLVVTPIAVIIAYKYSLDLLFSLSLILFAAGMFFTHYYIKYLATDDHDPSFITIDETAAIFFGVYFYYSYVGMIAQQMLLFPSLFFALFRLFDIKKPLLIGEIQRKYTNAFGVMADDIAAAIFAAISCFVLLGIVGNWY